MNAAVGGEVARKNMAGGRRTRRKARASAASAKKIPAVGSKAQVWNGNAKHTPGGLEKKDLMRHKGRIVSKKKHALGKKAFKHLVNAGYKPKKGTFKIMKK